jgi:diguanylate cyclase (GGDEF)-like protein
VLLVAAIVAEAFPVPVEGVSAGGVSLAAAFLVGAAVVYDWEVATILGFLVRATIELAQRRPAIRLAYNSATYALAAATAGAIIGTIPTDAGAPMLALAVAFASAGFYVVNIALIAVIVARVTGTRFDVIVATSVRWTAIPFAIMGSVSLMLAVLWQRSPGLVVALLGPIVATVLYQRSTHRALDALRLANTDPLTGLGNHRAFYDRLAALLAEDARIALCVLDADGFKRVNDRLGHKAGDELLKEIATVLREGGESFRIGGDEFALLLTGPTDGALDHARAVVSRIEHLDLPGANAVTVSAGVAVAPLDACDGDGLFAAADAALYHAKLRGKNRVEAFRPDLVQDHRDPSASARLRTAWKLAEIMDEVGDLGGAVFDGHPTRVAELAVRIARRFDVRAEDLELLRLAAQLHDIGKVAIPVEILAKDDALDRNELRMLGDHPRVGARILAALGGTPIAEWVYHHHERWDGLGYPDRLEGEEIPLASRIIFVADAFDAMTSDRPYRKALTVEEAVAELHRCSGTQFDPAVVAALLHELGVTAPERSLVVA